MDAEDCRQMGRDMIDFVVDYLRTLRERRPQPDVQPGYLMDLIPSEAPLKPDKWEDLLGDIDRVIMPGASHWQSPHYHAYFPSGSSMPSICADILSDAMGCIGFTWAASPACTELEVVMMDWLAKMLHLPEEFMSGGKGGGVIESSASESTLLALYAARSRKIDEVKQQNCGMDDDAVISKLVAYVSDEAHVSVEKAFKLAAVKNHVVVSDESNALRGQALAEAIAHDKEKGLIPFYCVATLGTTQTCSFDKLLEVGPVCNRENMWLHVDAAYAGSAFICPEYRPLLDGVEFTDSFNFGPHKWMLVNYDCSALWLKDKSHLVSTLSMDTVVMRNDYQELTPTFVDWQIPGGRRFRSLKIWFVLRMYGIEGLQSHIRKHVSLANEFEGLVKSDSRFEVVNEVKMGLVCFRLKGSNSVNQVFLRRINADGKIHVMPGLSKGVFFIRFVTSNSSKSSDVVYAWESLLQAAESFISDDMTKVR